MKEHVEDTLVLIVLLGRFYIPDFIGKHYLLTFMHIVNHVKGVKRLGPFSKRMKCPFKQFSLVKFLTFGEMIS